MPTIEVLTDRVEPVAKTAMTGEILARFEREPNTMVIPVVDGDRPIGLIERGDFLLKLAGPLGQSLYGGREVTHLMDPEPAVIDAGVRVDAFSSIILKSGPGALMRGFIVTHGGAYRGVGTAVALLRAINEDQRHENQSLVEQLRSADEAERSALTAARDKSRFMGLLNRELSTSMNGVLAVAELLHRQPLNDAAKAHARTIMDSAEDMLDNLRDALDLARAEAGELQIAAAATPLRTLMDDIQSHWSPRAAQDGVTLMVGYEGDTELAAMVDQGRLRQVFNNLIGNALKFARHGMVEASLKVQTQGDRVLIEARVRDDGPSDDNRAGGLIDPSADDAGLSLAISRRLIECMDGRIWAENNTGRGATFAFDLSAPIAFIEREEPTNVADLDQFQLHTRPHVLIADDNATNRVVAQALCEMFGCTSEAVEDGQEAVEAVESRPFDLILMDIKMPRLDGIGATRAIRALASAQRDIPIIALTANADPDDAKAYLAAGMAAVVEKPIKPERLRLAMNTALEPAVAQTPARARGAA
ncbi:response regulator [Brevundimonas naejangsanensis]|uniref:histidine kinase n=1 Tax=Brevundimonas naejangsanensis TaxID=588932 RepID=A0A494RH89_9CAUL|nr:response regulator [Brevundimonas naejangsanensis]AYG95805.1 response regulator [Brevundimonas naejangsanensis]